MADSASYLVLNAGSNDASANIAGLIIDASFDWGHTEDPTGDRTHTDELVPLTISVDETKPCKNCSLPVQG